MKRYGSSKIAKIQLYHVESAIGAQFAIQPYGRNTIFRKPYPLIPAVPWKLPIWFGSRSHELHADGFPAESECEMIRPLLVSCHEVRLNDLREAQALHFLGGTVFSVVGDV